MMIKIATPLMIYVTHSTKATQKRCLRHTAGSVVVGFSSLAGLRASELKLACRCGDSGWLGTPVPYTNSCNLRLSSCS